MARVRPRSSARSMSFQRAGRPALRPVDQVEVDLLDRRAARGCARARATGRARAGKELRGHEHLVAGHAAGAKRRADARLVAVVLRRVDVAVAGLERPAHGVLGLRPVRHLPDAESEQRHLDAAPQGPRAAGAGRRSGVCVGVLRNSRGARQSRTLPAPLAAGVFRVGGCVHDCK